MRRVMVVVVMVVAGAWSASAAGQAVDSFYVSSSSYFRVVLSGIEPGMRARCAVQDAAGTNLGVSGWTSMDPPVDELTVRVPNARSVRDATVQCWTQSR